jgi:antibiotic biosynthesis monooxygenase (ABM) superfamily enzyme
MTPQPVTVSITRHIAPGHDDEMIAWMRAGTMLAGRFDGFLGSGWVKPAVDSTQWHMLYRFADAESLAAWEESSQRQWWLGAAQGLVGESKVERFTGIEGWFDPPTSYDHVDLRPGASPPPRWKQSLVIFAVFFPLSLVVNYAMREVLPDDLPLGVRVLATIVVMTPIMTYAALPWITARMAWFLHGTPPPWRRTPRSAEQPPGRVLS